jgi:hypothetical protein
MILLILSRLLVFLLWCWGAWSGCQVAGSVSSYGRGNGGHVKDTVARESSRVIQGSNCITVNFAAAWLTSTEF